MCLPGVLDLLCLSVHHEKIKPQAAMVQNKRLEEDLNLTCLLEQSCLSLPADRLVGKHLLLSMTESLELFIMQIYHCRTRLIKSFFT